MSLQSDSTIRLDREQAFLLYATFTGDVERVAHALNVRAIDVLRIADEDGWTEKLKPIIELKKSTRPGDMERAINRALNFVQAHKFRMFIDRVIFRLCGMGEKEFESMLMEKTSSTGHVYSALSTRAVADLASALEKCQSMSYQALNDTTQERVRRNEDNGEEKAGELHQRIAFAMSKVKSSSTIRAKLFDAQIEQAERQSVVAKPKLAPPVDDTYTPED
jgi:hypothetical protein